MFRWIMEKDSKRLMEQCLAQEDEESALKYLLTVAIGLRPYVEIGVQTNYGKELAQLLIEFIYGFFEQLMERTGRYAHLSYSERKIRPPVSQRCDHRDSAVLDEGRYRKSGRDRT